MRILHRHQYRRKWKQPKRTAASPPSSQSAGPSTSQSPQSKRSAMPKSRRGKRGKKATKQKRRCRPKKQALILQESTELLLRKAPFARLVREISMKYSYGLPYSWERTAILALQVSAEDYLVQLFKDTYTCCLHAKRVTLQLKDIKCLLSVYNIQDELE